MVGETKFYQVSEAAKMLGVSSRTLKNWEDEKDFPKPKRDRLHRRVYTEADLEKIREFKKIGYIFDPNEVISDETNDSNGEEEDKSGKP